MNILNRFRNKRIWGMLLLPVVLLLLPFVFNSPYMLSIMVVIGLYSIVAMGLCLLMGFTGQISVAQAAFYGIGAYSSAILTTSYGFSPWIALLIGCVISAVVAFIIGFPTLKLEENYLALATLGFGIIVYVFFVELVGLTGGPSGIRDIPRLAVGNFKFDTDFEYYFLTWSIAFGLLLFSASLVRSRVGRALRAIRGSELAAESIGINATSFKVKIFMLSAVFASIAGSLYAHYITFINPSPFYVTTSIHFLIIAVVGGLTNVWGGIVGAMVITGLSELLREVVPKFVPEAGGEYEIILFGVILVATMIFMPQGLTVAMQNRWFKSRNGNVSGNTDKQECSAEGDIKNDETIAKSV
jgi:branched-chain amino acid transport system permease protein